ncbi:MAG: acetate kinase [Bacteroidales bacterium]|nr:acetate kinase [Bacteroidales bacterium]
MQVLVLNCGSSSIKFQLFNMQTSAVLSKGIVEKVGADNSFVKIETNGNKEKLEYNIPDHTKGVETILELLVNEAYGPLNSYGEIDAVGHRVVHGGEHFSESVLINQKVIDTIEELSALAPLHNPANLKGIYAIQKLLPKVPQVGVFDTGFHQTMPDYAYFYGLPYEMYEKYDVRRYGFHGTSHRYVYERACEVLGVNKEDQKVITCHLGNGASVTAIDRGKSVDTSMGLTPVEGLIMGTRCGDLDVGALTHIMEKEDMGVEEVDRLINKESGMYGISGVSSDMREIREAAREGSKRAILALKMYDYRVKKYIGAYTAAMGGVDIIVLTGGVGENDYETREDCLKDLEYMGVEFDSQKNDQHKLKDINKELIITKDHSKVTGIVVPTNEELVIARDTQEIVGKA